MRGLLATVLLVAGAGDARAGEAARWACGVSANQYLIPGDDDFASPVARADRGTLHLEARYNYEDLSSFSAFAGRTFTVGGGTQLALTPMVGGVVGRTSGFVPALEADFTAGVFEAYAESEYVIDPADGAANYFYMWSEASIRPREWARAGVVVQRNKVHGGDRDVQPGLLVGGSWRRIDGAAYFFDPGGNDAYTVLSLGLLF